MPGKPMPLEATALPAKISFDVAAFRFAKATEILMRADQRLREVAASQEVQEATKLEVQEERTPKPKEQGL